MKRQSTNYEELQGLHEARRQWERSEAILNILRTETAEPIKQLTDDEVMVWNHNAHPQSAN